LVSLYLLSTNIIPLMHVGAFWHKVAIYLLLFFRIIIINQFV
jgi:hypothetical protein